MVLGGKTFIRVLNWQRDIIVANKANAHTDSIWKILKLNNNSIVSISSD